MSKTTALLSYTKKVNILLPFVLFCVPSCLYPAQSDFRIDGVDGPVYTILGTSDCVWIAAANGIFRWNYGSTRPPILQPVNTGAVYEIAQSQNFVWFGTDEGLFRWQKGSPSAPELVTKVHEIYTIDQYSDGLWLGTKLNGLYDWKEEASTISLVLPPFGTGWINDVHTAGTSLWIATEGGLYRWDQIWKGHPYREPVVTGEVFQVRRFGNTVWAAADNGLFRSEIGSKKSARKESLDTGWVGDIQVTKNTVWFGTQKGLYGWREGAPRLYSADVLEIYTVREMPDGIWLGTDEGVYRIPAGGGTKASARLAETGRVFSIYQSGTTFWIGAKKGLFRIEKLEALWDAQFETSGIPTFVTSKTEFVIRWNIGNFAWRAARSTVKQRVFIYDRENQIVNGERSTVDPGRFDFNAAGLAEGKYTIVIEAKDVFGNIAHSPSVTLTVKPATTDQIAGFLKYLALIYALANVLAFFALTIAARWSRQCFLTLTDPTVRKISLYFGLAFRYVPWVRRWVFERYYDQLRTTCETSATYLPGIALPPEKAQISTTRIFDDIPTHRHIWIQGKSGTGKTALVVEMMRLFSGQESLKKALKQKPYIPILVRLRQFSSEKALDLIRRSLESFDMPIDEALLISLLRTGALLVIFDGLNEASSDKDVLDFCNSYQITPTVITTQTVPPNDSFWHVTLPPITGAFAQALLPLFLGDEKANRVISGGHPSLWEAVESGYDVHLIADLARNHKEIPTSRLELFEATVSSVGLHDSDMVSVSQLAWNLWKNRQHRFNATSGMTREVLIPLSTGNVTVIRGNEFEFRHDLMQAYLAACWVTKYAGSWEVSRKRLLEKEIWDLSPSEQRIVFEFVAVLSSSVREFGHLVTFASEDAQMRQSLLVVLFEHASTKRYRWTLNESS
jgi:hypothetical protein